VVSLNEGVINGLEVDPATEEVRWGSIYWAKVARIDKALDAAFVNIDGENIGLLHNADVIIKKDDGSYERGGDKPIGKYLEPGQMIAVQAKSGYLPSADGMDDFIADDKNPRLSMNIALPGRYIIYTPMVNENRVSQRIKDKKLRKQLMDMLAGMESEGEENDGCILRSAAANTQTDVLIHEAKIQKVMWEQIQKYFKGKSPSLIMLGPDAMQRMLSDNADRIIDRIDVTALDRYQDVEEWCELYAPDLMTKVNPVEVPPALDLGLLEQRDIVDQIEGMFQPYAFLKGGGSVIIQETAALFAIDVNRGADKRSALDVNIEAAEEIARQLRIRNVGGIIVIDFLKMKAKAQKDKLAKALEEAFGNDPCTVQFHGMTNLGLYEITRHRRTPPLQDRFESVIG
jgi:Rne/Rng family ribonuclease